MALNGEIACIYILWSDYIGLFDELAESRAAGYVNVSLGEYMARHDIHPSCVCARYVSGRV